MKDVGKKCDIQVTNKQHYSLQLNKTTYLTYDEVLTLINVHCIDRSGKAISVFSGNARRIVGYNHTYLCRFV